MLRTFTVCSPSFFSFFSQNGNICAPCALSLLQQLKNVSRRAIGHLYASEFPESLFKTSNDFNEHWIFHVVHFFFLSSFFCGKKSTFFLCFNEIKNNDFLYLIYWKHCAHIHKECGHNFFPSVSCCFFVSLVGLAQ